MSLDDDIDDLARRIVAKKQEWREQRAELPVFPPRPGKYKDDAPSGGVFDIPELQDYAN